MTDEGQRGITFESDGITLLGTLFLAAGSAPRPTVLLLHGVPGIEKNYDVAHMLRERGWNSLIFHYRGSWGSAGDYGIASLPIDVIAAIDALTASGDSRIDPARIILIGHSMGGYAAVLAAAADPRPIGVAVYGAVTDPRTLNFSDEVVASEFTPWLQGMTPSSFQAQWKQLPESAIPVEQVSRIAPRPLLILHGEADPDVPVSQAEALYQRAGEPRELMLVPGADHGFIWQRDLLRQRLFAWLEKLT